MRPRPRGTGSVFRKPGTSNWWVKYYRNGVPFRESSGTPHRRKAEKFLQKRLGEIGTGSFAGPRAERVLVRDLAEDLLRAYRTGVIRGAKSLKWSESRWALHLAPFLGTLRAVQVEPETVERYIESRQRDGAANATINRELAFLSRAFRRGREAKKLVHVPRFPRLVEKSPRQGFLEDAQYRKLSHECGKVGLWLRAVLAVGCTFGWRKGEVLSLRVRQVDAIAATIRLDTGTTKNQEGRTVRMTAEVASLLAACLQGKQADDYVFTRDDGARVKDFRKAWTRVCEAAGVPGLLFHDLRRTGARNLRRLGVGETTIMKIAGWKTASTFRRYDIVSEEDLADAARRLDEKAKVQKYGHSLAEKEKTQKYGHSSGTVTPGKRGRRSQSPKHSVYYQ